MRCKRIICLLLLVSVISALFAGIPFGSVSAEEDANKEATIQGYKDQISDLEAEQKELEAEISKLKADKKDASAQQYAVQKKIDNLQSQISLVQTEINSCTEQTKKLEKEIIDKNKELEETKYIFKQRLRAIAMSGGTVNSSIAVLLSSDDLSELLTRTELTRSISAYDNALMEKIINDVNDIEKKKAEIAALAEEQKEAKSKLDSKKRELNSEISGINKEISDISGEMSNYQSQINALEKAIKEYENAIKNAQSIGSDQYYSGQFTWPCPGYHTITSPYGYRLHPITKQYKFHKGVDISGGNIKGKPIVAAADGIVSLASYNAGGYGNYVMVNHGTGSDGKVYVTLYAHMTKYCVSVGQQVKKGQTIGYVGTTGASTGPHLHFEIRINGDTVNPLSYVK